MTIADSRYTKSFRRGQDGSLADSGFSDLQKRVALQDVPFGKLLFRVAPASTGSNIGGNVKLPDGTDNLKDVEGMSVFSQAINDSFLFMPVFPQLYPMGQPIIVMLQGRGIILPEQEVTVSDPVYFRTKQLNPDGQDQTGIFTFSKVPTAGTWKIQFDFLAVTHTTGVLAFNATPTDVANAITAVLPIGVARASGNYTKGISVDWGDGSQTNPLTNIKVVANSLTSGIVLVVCNYQGIDTGYPPGTRYGVGRFRKDSDFGSCQNANGELKRFRWSQGSDVDGLAVLELC